MIRLLLALLLAATPAAAQRGGCGFGLGLDALRTAGSALRDGMAAGSMAAGRAAAEAAAGQLADAATRLDGCGCDQAAGHARDAARLAEEAGAAASLDHIRRTLDRAGFSAGLARERLERQGCS